MFILNQHDSIANEFLADIRDISVQSDRLRFRKNLERLGQILAYEASKSMDFQPVSIETPLEGMNIGKLQHQPVIISVLRAAMPFFSGVLDFFDKADAGFIGAFRKTHQDDNPEVEIALNYLAAPSIEGRELILVDPMLATGKSFMKSIDQLITHGRPKKIHIMAIIAAPEGIKFIKDNLDLPHEFWIGALDTGLNQKAYIVPGLGDAGDLAFGPKL
ncbi:uracil phosphoribosyltransferase [Pararhodonellum marinum]|uniref:uracil phosphoribosyltransferase n=1 Tax=Pararhodonellum marinum TaxID=2755358 RepID=UPI00188FCBF5|nr:uracil phosphoribosyltransferase [Pararhodonellum marinum]